MIVVLQKKVPLCALSVLTLIALGTIGLLARLGDFRAVTGGTLHRDRDPRLPPRTILMQDQHTGKLLIWNITRNTTQPVERSHVPTRDRLRGARGLRAVPTG